jgi:multidrug efflux pump subunit AcrA (membrane-fusion protein)
LITRGQGIQVAVVAADNTVHLRTVEVGRDYGNTVEILSGLRPGEQVIDNPPDAVSEGMTVQVAAAPSAPAK